MVTFLVWRDILTEKKYFIRKFIMPSFSEIVLGVFMSIFSLFFDIIVLPIYIISAIIYGIIKGVVKWISTKKKI